MTPVPEGFMVFAKSRGSISGVWHHVTAVICAFVQIWEKRAESYTVIHSCNRQLQLVRICFAAEFRGNNNPTVAPRATWWWWTQSARRPWATTEHTNITSQAPLILPKLQHYALIKAGFHHHKFTNYLAYIHMYSMGARVTCVEEKKSVLRDE